MIAFVMNKVKRFFDGRYRAAPDAARLSSGRSGGKIASAINSAEIA
jgi:hypothetical protein